MYSADEIPILYLSGYELTCEYLEENGFTVPIIVDSTNGLDVVIPPPSFTVQDVENCVGMCHISYIFPCDILLLFSVPGTSPSPLCVGQLCRPIDCSDLWQLVHYVH